MHKFEALRAVDNAETLANANEDWNVVRGFVILELCGTSPRRFIALKHAWNALPSGAWLDLTPLCAGGALSGHRKTDCAP